MCGSGSIGKRHITNLRSMGHDVGVWRYSEAFQEEFIKDPFVLFESDLAKAIRKSDAVVIATSTDSHLEILELAVEAQKPIYIEKPLSHTTDGIAEIGEKIRQEHIVVQVGCQYRSHPALRFLRQYIDSHDNGPLYTFLAVVGQRLDEWRPKTDYRKCYSSAIERGGGALLDLIHEVDLMLWFTGDADKVYAEQSQISDQAITADDLANLVLKMKNGAVGQIQLDMLSPVYRRYFELVFQKVIYRWNDVDGNLIKVNRNTTEIIYSLDPSFERNDLFVEHMGQFISLIGKQQMAAARCTFEDGVNALKVAYAAKLAATTGRKVSVEIP